MTIQTTTLIIFAIAAMIFPIGTYQQINATPFGGGDSNPLGGIGGALSGGGDSNPLGGIGGALSGGGDSNPLGGIGGALSGGGDSNPLGGIGGALSGGGDSNPLGGIGGALSGGGDSNPLGGIGGALSGGGDSNPLGGIGGALSGGEDPKVAGDAGCVIGGILGGLLTETTDGAAAGCMAGKKVGNNFQKSTETDLENCNYGYNSETCNYRHNGPTTEDGNTQQPVVTSLVPIPGKIPDQCGFTYECTQVPIESGIGCTLGGYIGGGSPCDLITSKIPTEEASKPYSIPNHVQTSGGSKWSTNPGDPSTWSIVAMTDSDHRGQYKVIDEDGKNVAANFNSQTEAQEYING
ncbi:hypothetical protein NMY3_03040 [Candidatus Nitrosocosmicus oleophilus]|uniref:Uncharacterized protein n=1 Tax=Candidatus Nitrosocosmicus oleophilus TaxID=1353260 RepID=A0A654M219_9ARCH|nr:hypothetical protein [Candidatus Nitrosocosmicus oleophilus]ALI37227.1 hypothetical protein NMY3_03040 [Candidatus Nitrosocosmicus oleophilus]